MGAPIVGTVVRDICRVAKGEEALGRCTIGEGEASLGLGGIEGRGGWSQGSAGARGWAGAWGRGTGDKGVGVVGSAQEGGEGTGEPSLPEELVSGEYGGCSGGSNV